MCLFCSALTAGVERMLKVLNPVPSEVGFPPLPSPSGFSQQGDMPNAQEKTQCLCHQHCKTVSCETVALSR